jgi:hypothetical protein
MFWIVLLVGAVAFFYWRSVRRGKVFVRSVDFLMMLDGGSSVEEANKLSHVLLTKRSDPNIDNRAIRRASAVADAQFGGKQLPLIVLAKSKGFVG